MYDEHEKKYDAYGEEIVEESDEGRELTAEALEAIKKSEGFGAINRAIREMGGSSMLMNSFGMMILFVIGLMIHPLLGALIALLWIASLGYSLIKSSKREKK